MPVISRGNLRELSKLMKLNKKLRRLLKPNTLIPVIFLLVLFLAAGFVAITQETGDEENHYQDGLEGELYSLEEGEEGGAEPEFIPVYRPPRWFRSNAGGMAIEETPSRLGALRSKYALLIDYVAADELDPRLLPFYKDEYSIEIRILYMERKESRRQWLFRDKDDNTKVNAVFRMFQDEEAPDAAEPEAPAVDGETGEPGAKKPEGKTPGGFIEVFNDNGRIFRDYSLFEDNSEILTAYFYNENTLIKTETQTKDADNLEYKKTYTDIYRYNRSYSLRNVERIFHEPAGIDPVRLLFPARALEAAYEKDFLKEKLTFSSDFLGGYPVDAGFRIVYDTDSKGRVLSETLYNSKNEVVWTLENTWAGDRIAAILKIEGDDKRLIEYDYDSSGSRIAERDFRNGVLERQVFIDGNKETEELYLNGVVVLRAFWEDGRKISEERIRRR